MEETLENDNKSSEYLDPETKKFKPGNPGGGRYPETPEQKAAKKALKEIIADYKEKLTEALPKIEPVLVNKALRGDLVAIKELHDRVMGKPQQYTDVTSGGRPLILPSEIIEKNNINEPSEDNSSRGAETGS